MSEKKIKACIFAIVSGCCVGLGILAPQINFHATTAVLFGSAVLAALVAIITAMPE